MSKIKSLRRLSARQWLGLDAAGSFLAGCWIFWRTARLMDDDTSEFAFMGGFILVLYLLPVFSLLGLAALLLWAAMGEKGDKPSRVLTFFGSVPHILVGVLHFGLMEGSTDALLNLLAALVVGAGVAGIIWAALFAGRAHTAVSASNQETKPPNAG